MSRPEYFVGIDVASQSFTSTVLSSPREVVRVTETPNSPEGFAQFVSKLQARQITAYNSVAIMEATGVYGEKLCYFLHSKGYRVAVEPPNEVKKAFKSKRKNDTVDSRQIAEYGYRFFDGLRFWEPKPDLLQQIGTLLTTREQFTKQLTADKNSLRALSRKAVQTPMANRLFEKNIRRLKKDIEAIDKAIQQLIDQDPSLKQKAGLVEGIPGVGLLLTANLMVITSGFNNLDAKSLAAYLGICPYEHESGSSVRKRPRSDRYGTGKARKLLHLAARSTATHKHNFRAYYLRKLAEGKPKRLALNNIANRLLRIICAVVRDGSPYCETHRSVHPALVA